MRAVFKCAILLAGAACPLPASAQDSAPQPSPAAVQAPAPGGAAAPAPATAAQPQAAPSPSPSSASGLPPQDGGGAPAAEGRGGRPGEAFVRPGTEGGRPDMRGPGRFEGGARASSDGAQPPSGEAPWEGFGPRGSRGPSPEDSNPNLRRVDERGNMQGPFYFADESPVQVIQILEALMRKPILQSQGLAGIKINFVSKRPMPREEAITALTALLSLNGVAILPLDGQFMRAVPVIGVNRQSPEFLSGDISKMTPNQNFYTMLFELEYVDALSVSNKIKPFMSLDGVAAVESFPRSNALLITDTLINLQRASAVIKKLDVPLQLREDVAFIPVKNTSASDVREKLVTMQNDLLKKYFDNTTIDVDSRTNQLIVVTQKGNLEAIKTFIKGLDVEAEPILKNEVFYIRHCKAEEIQNVLRTIIQQQQQQAARSAQNKRNAANTATRNAIMAAQATRAGNRPGVIEKVSMASGDGTTGFEFSEFVQVVAHTPSSSVVVYGTPADLKQISGIIRKLDIAIDQVKIDVIVTEVLLTDSQVSGLSSFGISFNNPFTGEAVSGTGLNRFGKANQIAVSTSTDAINESSTSAFSLGLNEGSMAAVFDIARQNQNVRVLSSPTIVTTHAEEAIVQVAENYPMITSSTSDMSDLSTAKVTIERQDIGLELTVTPYVGTDSMIQLQIEQKVQSIARYVEIVGESQPVVSTRRARSKVSAKNNELIVLAGLQHVEASESDGGVWLLGDLPLIGGLFRPSSDNMKRRELIIFIRPTAIRSMSATEALADRSISESDVKREMESFIKTGKFYDNAEVRANFEEFEKNRFYNRLIAAPHTLITDDGRIVEGSTKDRIIKEAKAAEEERRRREREAAENAAQGAPAQPENSEPAGDSELAGDAEPSDSGGPVDGAGQGGSAEAEEASDSGESPVPGEGL